MSEDLDKIFADHKNRKQKKEEAKRKDQSRKVESLQKANQIAQNTICPILESIKDNLIERGYPASVLAGQSEQTGYPVLSFSFNVPRQKKHQLVFRMDSSNEFLFVADNPANVLGGGTSNFRLLKEVDSNWVNERTLAFIEGVLRLYER